MSKLETSIQSKYFALAYSIEFKRKHNELIVAESFVELCEVWISQQKSNWFGFALLCLFKIKLHFPDMYSWLNIFVVCPGLFIALNTCYDVDVLRTWCIFFYFSTYDLIIYPRLIHMRN